MDNRKSTISLRKIFLLLFISICCFSQVKASHYAAADIFLDYVGSGPNDLRYRITVVLFKACDPGSIDLADNTTVDFSSSCGGRPSLNLPMTTGPDTLDQLCDNKKDSNSCRYPQSIYPGFERRIYTGEVVLPVACTDWLVSWQDGSRNQQIINLTAPNSLNIYVEAGINNVAKYDGSTPRFTVDPIPYICANQNDIFLNGPFDPDNDSLYTKNAVPWTNANTPVPYAAPYTNANPFDSPTGYTVDPNTGTAMFLPTTIAKYVMAFEVSSYEKGTGTYLGHTRRDVQVSVLYCVAGPPAINPPSGITGGGMSGTSVLGCPDVQLTFNINAQTTFGTNAVILTLPPSSQVVVPNATFTVANQNTANPIGTFTWTPTNADIGDYTVIFIAKDSTCANNQPIILQNYYVAFIKIQEGIEAGPDGLVCDINPGEKPFEINVTGPSGITFNWIAADNSNPPEGLAFTTGAYNLASPENGMMYFVETPDLPKACKYRDTVSVWIDTSNSVAAMPDAVLCRPGYFTLDAEGVGPAPYRNLECGTTDIQTCTLEDTLVVGTQASKGVVLPSPAYTPFSTARTAITQFMLTKSDLYYHKVRAGTLRGLAFEVDNFPTGATQTYDNFTISVKCTDRKDLSAATGGIETGMTQVYSSPSITLAAGWNQFTFDTPYSHDSTKGLIVEVCYTNAAAGTAAPVMKSVSSRTVFMAYSYANAGTTSICQNPGISASTSYYTARPTIRLNYCPADSVPFNFTWYPGDLLSDSTLKRPLAYLAQTTEYQVATYGRNGCKVIDSTIVNVPIHDYDVWPKDTTICYGTDVKMVGYGSYDKIKWYEKDDFSTATNLDCDDCREPITSTKVTTRYKAVLTDKDGCSDTFTVNINIKPLPIVQIINKDTVLKYGQSMRLMGSGAYLYSWQPISTLTNPNIVNPIATPTEPTTYYVIGLAENGCRNIDSVRVNIDYRDNLYVPSAFTPNGDGKNDVFRVSNITFQKLQEFRVFNRWGQEIFSTTDPLKGWDGGWKGVPQDMGAYQYLIKVGYPDGFIETYKGNVTLVR